MWTLGITIAQVMGVIKQKCTGVDVAYVGQDAPEAHLAVIMLQILRLCPYHCGPLLHAVPALSLPTFPVLPHLKLKSCSMVSQTSHSGSKQ